MSQTNPAGANTSTVEPKVQVMTIVTYLVSLILLGIGEIIQNGTLLQLVPPAYAWITVILTPLIPGLLTLIAGYAAKHQWRYGEGTSTVPPGTSGVNTP